MAGYTDELSIKLTARDEMSAKLRETRKQLSGLEKDMAAARKQVQDTGSPEAVAELKRLERAWGDAAKEQEQAAKGIKDAKQALEALKKEAGKAANAVDDVRKESGRADDAVTKMARKTTRATSETKKLESASHRLGRQLGTAAAKVLHLDRKLDGLQKATSKADGRMGKLGITAGLAAAGGIAAVATGSVVAGKALLAMTKGAMEDEAGQKKLAGQLKTTTKATGDQVAKLEDWISRQGELTGFADDKMRPALARLADSFGSIGKAKDMTELAMDIATAKGLKLTDVSKALAKANDGQVDGLKKLGITLGPQAQNLKSYQAAQRRLTTEQGKASSALELFGPKSKQYAAAMDKVSLAQQDAAKYAAKGTDVFGELGKQFAGQTSENAKTLEGRMQRLSLIADETKETIGAGLIPVATTLAAGFQDKVLPAIRETASKVLPKLREGFKVVSDAIEENRPGLKRIGTVMAAFGAIVIEKVIPALAKVQFKAWAVGIDVITDIGTAAIDTAPTFLRFAATGVKAFRGLLRAANTTLESILDSAARTMGWIPGIGPKIKKAAAAFTSMKDKTDAALGKVEKGLKNAADGIDKWNAKARKAEAARIRGDIKDLEAKIGSAKKQLRDPKLTKPEKTKLLADIRRWKKDVDTAEKSLKRIPKTHITTLKLKDAAKVQGVANKLAAMNNNTIHVKFDGMGGGGFAGGAGASVSGSAGFVRPAQGPSSGNWARYIGGRRAGRWHGGADIGARAGSAVRASSTQQVKRVLFLKTSYGHHVVATNGRYDFVYAHMNSIFARPGQVVRKGARIGTVGSTGNSDGAHLHYEVRPAGRGNGSAINPYRFMRHGGRVRGPGTETSDSVPIMGSNNEFMLSARAARAIGYGRLAHMNRTGRIPNLPPIVSAPNVTVQAPSQRAPLVGQMNVYPSGQLDFEAGLAREARRQAREEARYAHARGA